MNSITCNTDHMPSQMQLMHRVVDFVPDTLHLSVSGRRQHAARLLRLFTENVEPMESRLETCKRCAAGVPLSQLNLTPCKRLKCVI